METWWRDTTVNPEAFDDERFVSEFIAPDRLWRRDFVTLQREGRLPAGSRLPEAVAERLRWDTLAELGYRSAIGRTLERTRASAVGVDRDALERACRNAHLRLREKFGAMRDLAPAAVRSLVLGVLRRMKDRGAIQSDVAKAWLAAGGGRWWLTRQPALQDFGPRSARPIFPVDTPHAADGIEPLCSRNGGRKSWYQAWAERVLTPVDVLAATREAPDVLLEALRALEDAGLVCRMEAGRGGPRLGARLGALLRDRAHRSDALRRLEPNPRRARAGSRLVAGCSLPGPRGTDGLRGPRGGPAHLVRAPPGKTVVAMHRARWLARNLPGRDRILFTTFTRNLAADIEHNLGAICKPEELARIDVTNLDRWVVRFLRGRRYEFRIAFGRNPAAWQRALDLRSPDLDLPDGFYDDEWEQVVQAHGVTTLDGYLRVSRVGRGSRLNRAARAKAWRVFDEYRTQLAERGLKEVDDAYRDAAVLLRNDRDALGYAAVIVDEAQDMGAQAYRLIRNVVPAGADDLFIVGDGHQRIYGRNRVVLGRCGIDVRGRPGSCA